MADDQVKYSDLFNNDVITGIENLNRALKEIKEAMADVKNEAASLGTSMRGMGTATREQQQQVSAGATAADQLRAKLEQLRDAHNKNLAGWTLLTRSIDGTNMSYDHMKATIAALEKVLHTLTTEEEKNSMGAQSAKEAISRLKAAMKSFSTTTEEVVRVNRAYKKLTDEEIASVEALKAALNGTKMQQMDAVKAIDIQSKSYNELYQTYNAIKEVLNGMTVAERENSEAGKLMVDRAKEIRDTLNNLQQQTGNYTQNVGNYMSALNGLQFQTQQVLREIPSAQNFSQFFLAISNNIPMFADALARYNQGLPEIKAKLAAVTAEIARQNAAMAAMNTQSAEYAAAQARLNELQRHQQQLQGASVSGWRAVLKAVGSWQTLLIAGLLVLRKVPEWIKKARDRARELAKEWKNIEVLERVAMTQLQMDITKATAETRNELDLIISKMGTLTQGSQEWQSSVKRINELTNGTLNAVSATPEEIRKVTKAYLEQEKQLATNRSIIRQLSDFDLASRRKSEIRNGEYSAEEIALLAGKVGDEKFIERAQQYLDARKNFQSKRYKELEKARNRAAYGSRERRKIQKEMNKLAEGYTSFDRELDQLFVSGSEKARRALMSNYVALDESSIKPTKEPKSAKEKDPVDNLLTLQRALRDAQIENIEEEYDRLEAAEVARHTRFLEDRKAELELLSADDPRRAVINQQIEEERETHDRKMLEIAEKYRQEVIKLREKEEEETEKAEKENAKARLKAMADGWQQQRAELVKEGKTRRELVEAEVAAEIARLKVIQKLNRDVNGEKMSDEQRQKVEEWIALLEKLQQTGNYGDYKPGQFMGKGAANVTNERKNYANIWEVLGFDMDSNQTSALNSVFDQAKEALNSWMDARKAAADQAKELADDEVSAAENALNREIELRNQGYANNVALRERELADAKDKQRRAMEEQKKIAQEQILLDAAMQTSSLITASANIWKQFGTQPALALALLGTMWGSFLYSKAKAYQVSQKSIQFREGGVMLLEGGSHESGHDVNLGIGPDGSNLRAEGGEYFAVINKRSSRKYGSQIPAVVNALNSGVFEDRYIKTSDAVGLMGSMGRMGVVGEGVDLSAVESGVGELVKQGESRWTVEGEYRVERYKNRVRRVKIGLMG